MCRSLGLFSEAIVAVDGSKFKAVNNRDKNFTDRKLEARLHQLEESIGRYLADLDRADRDSTLVTEARVEHLKRKIELVKAQMQELRRLASSSSNPPTDKFRLLIRTPARWQPVVAAQVWWAITCRPR